VAVSNQPARAEFAAEHFLCEFSVMTLLRPLRLVLPLCLAGCYLVDQRSFNAKAGRKPLPPVVAAPPAHVAPALVTIRYTTPDPHYHDVLANAVRRALARKPDALFSVTTLVPQAAGADQAAEAAATAAASGGEVAQAIVAAGAAPGQVEQMVSVDPSVRVREVIVKVQ
jgi:hypothetical protein